MSVARNYQPYQGHSFPCLPLPEHGASGNSKLEKLEKGQTHPRILLCLVASLLVENSLLTFQHPDILLLFMYCYRGWCFHCGRMNDRKTWILISPCILPFRSWINLDKLCTTSQSSLPVTSYYDNFLYHLQLSSAYICTCHVHCFLNRPFIHNNKKNENRVVSHSNIFHFQQCCVKVSKLLSDTQ